MDSGPSALDRQSCTLTTQPLRPTYTLYCAKHTRGHDTFYLGNTHIIISYNLRALLVFFYYYKKNYHSSETDRNFITPVARWSPIILISTSIIQKRGSLPILDRPLEPYLPSTTKYLGPSQLKPVNLNRCTYIKQTQQTQRSQFYDFSI